MKNSWILVIAALAAMVAGCSDGAIANGTDGVPIPVSVRYSRGAPVVANKLVFSVQPPVTGQAGAALAPAVQVQLQDAHGHVEMRGNVQISLALVGGSGAALGGTTTAVTAGGVATFANLTVDKAGAGYALVATASGFTGATSSPFSIGPAEASLLSFSAQPASVTAGAPLGLVQVTMRDAFGNAVTNDSRAITVSLDPPAANAVEPSLDSPTGASLSGVTSAAAVNGVATFAGLSVNKAGDGYTLSAHGDGLPVATSARFAIAPGAATRLAFMSQPSTVNNDVPLAAAVQVAVQDMYGNTVTDSAATVALAIGTHPGGGSLSGGTSRAATSGVASFSSLSIDKPGVGYTLVASSAGLSSTTSEPFDILLGPITGTRVAHYVTDTAQVDVAEDLSAARIGAYVSDGNGGFVYYAGVGTGAGTFSIANVPPQPYYLRFDQDYIESSARSVDLGYYAEGRPDVQLADAGTFLHFNFTNMTPWQGEQYSFLSDDIRIYSSNAEIYMERIHEMDPDGLYPAVGATALNQTLDFSQVAPITAYPPRLPNAALGDKTLFMHTVNRDSGVGGDPEAGIPNNTYLAIADTFTSTTLTVPDGQETTVSGAFSPLPQDQSYTLNWKLAETTPGSFGSYRSAIHPAAQNVGESFAITTAPADGSHGSIGFTPDLVRYELFNFAAEPDQSVTFTYGNPLPGSPQLGVAYTMKQVYYPLTKPDGSSSSVRLFAYISNRDLLSRFAGSQLQPRLSPVQNVLVNGVNGWNNLHIGSTPTLSWSPPAVGTPTYYRIAFRELYLDAKGIARSAPRLAGRILTTNTHVQIPPGLLEPGKQYVMVLTAYDTPKSLEMPYDSKFPLAAADVLSGILTVE